MLESVTHKLDPKLDTERSNNDDDSSQGQQETVVAPAPTSATLQSDSHPVVGGGEDNGDSSKFQLSQFELVRILSNNSTQKSVALLGHFRDLSRENQAIVTLEKTAFTEAQLQTSTSESDSSSSFFTTKSQLRTEFLNDVYGNFLCLADPEINQLKVTIIYPASEKHIVKFSAQPKHLLEEAAQDYQTVTLPYLEREQLSLEWLYNVLKHRKEQDRIVFEDPSDETGFILLPDLKWDGKTLEQLYLLALVRVRGIKSLRDLTGEHLPLLRNIKERGTKAIRERYGIGADKLRVYLHYQPTFYHLHVHFTFLQHDPPGIQCEKSHLLATVIGNLELVADYYQRATLCCVFKETDKLYEKLRAAKEKEEEEPESKRVKLE